MKDMKILATPGRLALALLLAVVLLPALWAYTITVSPADATGVAPKPVPQKPLPAPIRILMIGDSLSYGPFGQRLESRLRKRFGNSQVALYAAGGSSPENWLDSTPVFVTKCGYREATPAASPWMLDSASAKTPKIRDILAKWAPDIVLVQLGTNWMDKLPDPSASAGNNARKIVQKFISELRKGAPTREIIWILPPDSSKYSAATKQAVDLWISKALSEGHCAPPIPSRPLTGTYRKGVTGNDGVHYLKPAAEAWADKVYRCLLNALPEATLPQPPALLPPALSSNPPPR